MKRYKGILLIILSMLPVMSAQSADHNDPNAVNSIYADVPVSAADLYDIFAYPSVDNTHGEAVIVQLTFAPKPKTGIFDQEMMYTIHLGAAKRLSDYADKEDWETLSNYFETLKENYFNFNPAYIKVTFNDKNQARVDFIDFPSGDFHRVIDTNQVVGISTPDKHHIKAFIGGRDDAFFNTLHGFFRSINYAPQFYKVSVDDYETLAELPIPKTLLELQGNTLFNFDPANPQHGAGVKFDLPEGPYTWEGNDYKKDAEGNFRFVYDGVDAQAGRNINTVTFEIPLAFITKTPESERVVRLWGGSYVLKASSKIAAHAPNALQRFWLDFTAMFGSEEEFNVDEDDYNQVDHDGVPFSDAALSLRLDSRVEVNNLKRLRSFTKRFAHLGWGFGPSVTTLGLPTCFDHDDAPLPVHKTYKLATKAFPRVKKCIFQKLNMPDDSWNTSGINIPLKRTFEIFIPNLTTVDMDTNGTWPYGRRPEDQVATRFLAVFLDMAKQCGDQPCHVETLNNPALWQSTPLQPKSVPNPRFNDKPFLADFPYLAEPWPHGDVH